MRFVHEEKETEREIKQCADILRSWLGNLIPAVFFQK